eukprot:COSAG04_NODE_55_length_30619_cov_12.038991_8_plen_82_part_00
MNSAKAVADDEKLVRVLETAGEPLALSADADAEPQSNVDLAIAPAARLLRKTSKTKGMQGALCFTPDGRTLVHGGGNDTGR